MQLRRNVLLFHAGALGDFILTWPIALALSRLHPQSRVYCVTHGAKGKLAERAIGVDCADIDVGWHPLHGNADRLSAANLKLLREAHSIVSFVSDGAERWAENISRLAPQADLLFINTPPRGSIEGGLHVSEFFLRQLADQPALHTAVQQILHSIADRGIGGKLAGDGRVLIHPGAGGAAKCWPIDRFIVLAEKLKDADRRVEFVLGEIELEKWPQADVQRLSQIAPLQKPADLISLYQLIRSASCFVGNDSGPGHLAGIIGVLTTMIVGSSGPHSWRPLGPQVRIVEADSIEGVTVDQVLKTITG